jgi:hypothetical protein
MRAVKVGNHNFFGPVKPTSVLAAFLVSRDMGIVGGFVIELLITRFAKEQLESLIKL